MNLGKIMSLCYHRTNAASSGPFTRDDLDLTPSPSPNPLVRGAYGRVIWTSVLGLDLVDPFCFWGFSLLRSFMFVPLSDDSGIQSNMDRVKNNKVFFLEYA